MNKIISQNNSHTPLTSSVDNNDKVIQNDNELILTGIMSKICAWCRKDLGSVHCHEHCHGSVTHGICQSCKVEVEKEHECKTSKKVVKRWF